MLSDAQIEDLTFKVDSGLGSRARIGVIILQSDQTAEYEFSTLLRQDGVALYHSRIPNAMEVTPETLRAMEQDLPVAAALLPSAFDFDVIGYCCTSGATMIGEDRVDEIIRQIHPGAKTTNPLTACKAALAALDVGRFALVTPYAPSVTSEMQQNLAAAGFETRAVASFNQSDDFTVARISSDSILDAILAVGQREACEAVFVSCTSLRVLPVIAEAEAQLGKPVISSNQATAWHLMRLAGLEDRPEGAGRLFHH
ncbi:aspartate/glutamate racemase family protein [Albidovulum sediminicola]|uniref:Aspartate/glutamate racemase family protein n=1 Tax=Albidovulum sediminicola TaxID=2984331 RepID=A0ABT2Z0D0_9RHOB|nr:aspartate/glutamate racemase family protein [Defluviimonas sp. WL0075]MCV2864584.1 aspartate/glutamate racemase family protein [Defluviimonas sp. WL0075]